MKNNILMIFVLGFVAFSSCKEESIGQQPLDSTPPGAVSNVQVKNISGGAVFTYTLPNDEDLLYVKAVYSLKEGVSSEQRSSLYTDTLQIEGFGNTNPREVKLIAVDRSQNESAPVSVTITPLEPIFVPIGNSLELIADFGGVHAYWKNPTRADIAVYLLRKDNNDEYVPVETFYSTVEDGDGALRGLDTISGDFGLYVEDRWKNTSEVKYYTLTPIYETMFDRLKFRAIDLPTDAPVGAGWEKSRMFDGVWGEQGYSSQGGTGVWPQWITIDMGVVGQISRLRLYQRTGNSSEYIFAEGNPRYFEVWGCTNLDASGSWDSWTLLMDCASVKPSGSPMGTNTAEDTDRAKNGEDFINSPTNPKVRYLRIKVKQTWAGGDNFQISEIQVYGDNRP